jgi:hypothetical protein
MRQGNIIGQRIRFLHELREVCGGDFPEAAAKFFCERQSNITSERRRA